MMTFTSMGLRMEPDVGVAFLDLTDAQRSEAVVGINSVDILSHERVDRVAGEANADLVVWRGKITLHQAEVACAAADVDEEVSSSPDRRSLAGQGGSRHGSRARRRGAFRNQQDAVKDAGGGLADIFAGLLVGVGGDAHDDARISASPLGSARVRTCWSKSRARHRGSA